MKKLFVLIVLIFISCTDPVAPKIEEDEPFEYPTVIHDGIVGWQFEGKWSNATYMGGEEQVHDTFDLYLYTDYVSNYTWFQSFRNTDYYNWVYCDWRRFMNDVSWTTKMWPNFLDIIKPIYESLASPMYSVSNQVSMLERWDMRFTLKKYNGPQFEPYQGHVLTNLMIGIFDYGYYNIIELKRNYVLTFTNYLLFENGKVFTYRADEVKYGKEVTKYDKTVHVFYYETNEMAALSVPPLHRQMIYNIYVNLTSYKFQFVGLDTEYQP